MVTLVESSSITGETRREGPKKYCRSIGWVMGSEGKWNLLMRF
jgi:hypothetical protein